MSLPHHAPHSGPHISNVTPTCSTTGERLRSYFENYGVVREAFVSYNRVNGRPRGFGFVVFETREVIDKVVSTKHTIDRREVGQDNTQRDPYKLARLLD